MKHISLSRFIRTATVGMACLLAPLGSARPSQAQQALVTNASLSEPGDEGRSLAQRVGLWDVTETVWATPTASPVTTTGLVAERTLMGTLLQEVLRKPGEAAEKAVQRTDLLSYNRLEGRWGYVSFDTRAPVGIMPAWSMGRGDGKSIELAFTPFAVPVTGAVVTGQFLLMDQTIRYEDANRDVKDQFFTLADGSGRRWLAHRYAYTRHR